MPPRRTPTAARRAGRALGSLNEPETNTVVRVAFYRRASTDEGNQPYSLDAQEQRLRAHVAAQPGWQVTADYVERASGKDVENRAQVQRLLADAAAGKFDMVLVARIDRWSRSLIDLLDTVDHLDAHGVGFHSATEHFDTGTAMGRLLLQMLGMFAEFERSMIIDRIQRGNAAKIASGIPLNSRVGYGLRVDAHGKLQADPATIGVVKRIFREYVKEGKGVKAIATGLNEASIPSSGTNGWSQQNVARVIRNRAFIGEVSHRGTWHPGAHDPILDVELFDAAQAIADKRSQEGAAAATRRGDFVLTGTIRCGRCNGAYVGTSGTSSNGNQVRYYACGTARRYGAKRCAGPTLPADDLEHLIAESLLNCYTDTALFNEAIAAHLASHADRHEPLTEELTAVNRSIADKQRVRNRYERDYEDEKLSAERYEARAAKLDEELIGLQARAAELELELAGPALPNAPDVAELARLHEHLRTGIRTGETAARKELFTALVESIVVHERDDIRPTYRLYEPGPATDLLQAAPPAEADTATDETVEVLQTGSLFASRHAGWS